MSNIDVGILKGVIIIKERKTPIYLLKLEAAKRRVPVKHPSRSLLEEELWKQQAGLRGEKTLDYYLSLLSKSESTTLTNLRLPNKSSYFQIDTLVMTTRYILILESKNFAGELIYQASSNQLTQARIEKELVSYDPISQVERHKLQLLELLQVLQLPAIPVLTLVVLTNSYTTLKSNPEYVKIPSNIVRAEALPMKLVDINRIHRNEIWTTHELKKVANLLKKRNVSFEPNVLEKFKVHKEELIKGVHCPSCLVMGMERLKNGIWLCPNCRYKSTDAYKHTLNDYYLLISSEITNRELREFIGGLSVVTASRYLSKLNLKRTGKLKSTRYQLKLFS